MFPRLTPLDKHHHHFIDFYYSNFPRKSYGYKKLVHQLAQTLFNTPCVVCGKIYVCVVSSIWQKCTTQMNTCPPNLPFIYYNKGCYIRLLWYKSLTNSLLLLSFNMPLLIKSNASFFFFKGWYIVIIWLE